MATQISHNIRQSADVVEHSQSNVKAMFDALEKDENGEVTREMWIKAYGDDKLFDTVDVDHSGARCESLGRGRSRVQRRR